LIKDDKKMKTGNLARPRRGELQSPAIPLLEEDSPGDGIICADSGARSREVIQQQVVALIDGFLTRSTQN